MRYDGVIFDMDGTLLDSMAIWDRAASTLLAARGIAYPADVDETFKSFSLIEAADYVKRVFRLPESQAEIIESINRYAENAYKTVALKPGVFRFLSELAARGLPMAVATMTDRHLVLEILSRLGIAHFFRGITTCTEVGAGKDVPAVYEAALAILGTARERTLVFEDSHDALQTAKRAGFPVAAVADPSPSSEFPSDRAWADLAVESFEAFSVEDLK